VLASGEEASGLVGGGHVGGGSEGGKPRRGETPMLQVILPPSNCRMIALVSIVFNADASRGTRTLCRNEGVGSKRRACGGVCNFEDSSELVSW